MAGKQPTSKEMLLDALETIKARGDPPDEIAAKLPVRWDVAKQFPTELEDVRIARVSNHVIYVASLTKSAMRDRDPWTPRTSWSLYTARDAQSIARGGADDTEQAMRHGEIAYRALLGVDYKGD